MRNVAGQQRDWTAYVDGYQGMQVRLTVTATNDTVTLRAYAPPDPDQGKDQAPVGTLIHSRFTLAEPLGSRRFVRADGSPIGLLP
ncbi:hypothetical protein ACQB6R_10410 [Propionibacteriaceae bacterium G1746]|uniref:hypothetical protein n=1 Tax=Aestuariimicrobium sp. G57 TaxID=3418485 RepID=UPI003C2475EF